MCDACIADIVETGAAMSGMGCGSTQRETRALRAALEKIQLAEKLIGRMSAHSASVEQTEQIIAIRLEITAIISLITMRLRSMG
jgi:hypothetical protein